MKICIYGAGAIGGHLAVRLAQVPGNDVQVVARGPHLAAIREHGLALKLVDTPLHARVEASDRIADLPLPQLVFVTLKAHSIARAGDDLATLARGGAHLVFVSNGLPWWYGSVATPPLSTATLDLIDPTRLRERLAPQSLAGAVVYSPNTVVAPGVVHCHASYTRLCLGPVRPGAGAVAHEATAALVAAGVKAESVPDLRPEMFGKLLLNAALNPLGAITLAHSLGVVSDPVQHDLCLQILHEVRAVAASQGVVLAVDEGVFDPARVSAHKASMTQDFVAGRPLETDAILTNLQALAREGAVATPALDLVTSLVLARVRSRDAAA